MVALAAIGPLGRHPAAAMILYGSGFVWLIGLVRTFPSQLESRHAFWVVIALGIAARAAFIFFPPNTDVYRYVWEGAVQIHGFNPYQSAPADSILTDLAGGGLADIWQPINNKSLGAIYPPATMLIFRLLAWICPDPFLFKIVFLLFDFGIMAVLARMLRQRNLPASRLLLYSANPLAIVFIAGEAHMEPMQVFFLWLGVYFLLGRRHALAALSLGISVMIKYLALVAAPLFWRRGEGFKQAVSLLLPAVGFLAYASAGEKVFGSLATFGAHMHYNDGLMEVLRLVCGEAALATAGVILILVLAWIWLTEDDPLRGIYLACAWLLVLLPTLHPWYLLLVAPFLCFFPSRAWLYFQAAMLFTFPVLGQELEANVFREIWWLKILEYNIFMIILIYDFFRGVPFLKQNRFAVPQSISVVIPTLNEASRIGPCLSALKSCPHILEVLVGDAGSTDGTGDTARSLGARVIQARQGRGLQIRQAAQYARGDVVLILHADAILRPESPERIIRALTADPSAPGGCFGMAFREPGLKRRFIAALNNTRARVTGISFGDQAQFVRAEALRAIHGFPGLMLMEDVELALQMKGLGRPLYLGRGVSVSGRRWQHADFLQNMALVVGLFFRYLFDRRLGLNSDGKIYYRKYYDVGA